MKYKITKIGSVENPYHKDSNFGESLPFHVGRFIKMPEEGERFKLYPIDGHSGISTSPVVKVLDENTFETLNSIYHYERL